MSVVRCAHVSHVCSSECVCEGEREMEMLCVLRCEAERGCMCEGEIERGYTLLHVTFQE